MNLDEKKLKRILESAIFAAGRPLTIEHLGKLFEDDQRPSNPEIKLALASLMEDYNDRGVSLEEVASGWRFQSRQEFAPWIQKLWEERPARYSRASLETLSLIAYRQPVTRAEIEEIRGVSVSSSIIKSLLEREWVRVVGHRDVPGRPALYATTKIFLDYFNLKTLDELPTLAEIKDLESLTPQLDLEHKAPAEIGEAKTVSSTEIAEITSVDTDIISTSTDAESAEKIDDKDDAALVVEDENNQTHSIESDRVH